MPKKIERGDSLVSPGMVCYAEKQVKPFWSSSLGQMVLFDTIIFCRTFKNYFGQFVWIEKKRVTIIVAFHFMKRRLKKLAHTYGFEHEPSGLKGKHLTTRPRRPELCDLRAETRELSRGKKHPHFPITLANRKSNYLQ